MKANNTYTIFVTPLKGDEIRIEKACTLKQAVTLAKKEARKAIKNGGMLVFINIQTRGIYDTIETIAHIEATKEGRRVVFSDENPAAETYAVCWGVEYNEEDGESNAIAETRSEADAKEFAENESKDNKCRMCVVRKSDNKVIAIYDNTTPETYNAMNNNTTPANSQAKNTSANGAIDFTQFGRELVLYPENSADYPVAPYYVTAENKFLSNWRKEIDGRAAKEIYLCESWEEAQRVADFLRRETSGRGLANKYVNIRAQRPRLDTRRNIYSVRYNDGGNKAYNN